MRDPLVSMFDSLSYMLASGFGESIHTARGMHVDEIARATANAAVEADRLRRENRLKFLEQDADETNNEPGAIYIVEISNRLHAVECVRWVYHQFSGRVVPVEGIDVFGHTWPISELTLRSVHFGVSAADAENKIESLAVG